jgi:hypothetical protein
VVFVAALLARVAGAEDDYETPALRKWRAILPALRYAWDHTHAAPCSGRLRLVATTGLERQQTYTAVVKQSGPWWIGWIEAGASTATRGRMSRTRGT